MFLGRGGHRTSTAPRRPRLQHANLAAPPLRTNMHRCSRQAFLRSALGYHRPPLFSTPIVRGCTAAIPDARLSLPFRYFSKFSAFLALPTGDRGANEILLSADVTPHINHEHRIPTVQDSDSSTTSYTLTPFRLFLLQG